MADTTGPDRSLLERLNALKPTTVNLDSSSKSLPASTIESAKPLSRPDALSERLKSLRNQSDGKVHVTSSAGLNSEDSHALISASPKQTPQPQSGPRSSGNGIGTPQISTSEENTDDVDPSGNQTLEELLAELDSDLPWLEEVVAEEEEHRRVTALLEELGKGSTGPDGPRTKQTDDEDRSDDDSEGELMAREADSVLGRAVDEAEWEKANEPPSQPTPEPAPHSHDVKPSNQDNSTTKQAIANEDKPFSLPSVPSDPQDQHTLLDPSQDDDDFAASITSRIAALKVDTSPALNLPSVPTEVNELGLPEAPTFAPGDRPTPGLIKRSGYTDEDQKTWCIVCLEDGAIRCLDCDADVYCARCWKEMHVGPSAGYDERGHRWEKFVKAR
ncbi:hypothetical protein GGR54DRAFT_642799 [Hypoxylon sp. NC1633]|nr:hypothetical protein GGR54DRAFT_642799 [Hypoxylon sp. NC1633]